MSINYISHSQDNIKRALEPHFKRLGWDDIVTHWEMGPNFPGYTLSMVLNINIHEMDLSNQIDYKIVDNMVQPFADKLYNSPLIESFKKHHEEELQVLRDQLAVVEESNHKLIALLSEELEYIEID